MHKRIRQWHIKSQLHKIKVISKRSGPTAAESILEKAFRKWICSKMYADDIVRSRRALCGMEWCWTKR